MSILFEMSCLIMGQRICLLGYPVVLRLLLDFSASLFLKEIIHITAAFLLALAEIRPIQVKGNGGILFIFLIVNKTDQIAKKKCLSVVQIWANCIYSHE